MPGVGCVGTVGPAAPTSITVPDTLNKSHIKQRLRWNEMPPPTESQVELFNHMNSYRDVLLPQQTLSGVKEMRSMYTLHALNHVLQTRARVMKNSEKLKADPELEILDQVCTVCPGLRCVCVCGCGVSYQQFGVHSGTL